MVFTDPLFLFLFLPLLLAVYLAAPRGLRNTILLVASLGFYAIGEREYTAVMVGSIALNYLVGVALDSQLHVSRRFLLGVGIGANLSAMVFFKYATLLGGELNRVFGALGFSAIKFAPIHLPLGISFFVFQGMSYLIDVYRREVPAERNPFRFALFKALFPQLIAGPIVRYADVSKQLHFRHVSLANLGQGFERFVVGLAKKVLLANPVGAVADHVFGLPASELTGLIAWLGLICYSMQIYFDFSGYSDMAIGLGRVFGFQFRENFNYPYVAGSVTDFWRRWHLSLSTWFRDYLYIPLGGNRLGPRRTYLNLFVVFTLCGLWHGASWNFLIWGIWHGVLLGVERGFLGEWLKKVPGPVRHFYALVAVGIGWVFFRAETLHRAVDYFGALLGIGKAIGGQPFWFFVDSEVAIVLAAGVLGSTSHPKMWLDRFLQSVPRVPALTALLLGASLLLTLCVAKVAAEAYSPFIYFRF